MTEQQKTTASSFFQLSPFFVFIGSFTLMHLFYYHSPAGTKAGFALLSCLFAVMYSLCTFPKKTPLNKKIQLFVAGASQPTVLYMAFIFIISSVFSHVLTTNGAVTSAVTIGLHLIPPVALLPGLFLVISLFAVTIGSSMGSIAAFTPIALGFGSKLGVNPSLIAGIVVGGSMLGDNLSVISDTTIAAIQTTGSSMMGKLRQNLLFVVPSGVITLAILTGITFYLGLDSAVMHIAPITDTDILNIIPYGLVLLFALRGIDVLAVLTLGTLSALLLGLTRNTYTLLQATSFLFDGFYQQPGMVNVLILVLMIAGLAHIIEKNGGIEFLLEKCHPRITSNVSAQYVIALIVFFVNAAIVINTIAILITGPVATTLGKKYNISSARVAAILDVFSCTCQGLAPYTPQLLLAGAMAGVSSVSIIPYLHYQFAIAAVGVTIIGMKWPKLSNTIE